MPPRRAARDGGARRKPRRVTAVDPALAAPRASAATLLTGLDARVTSTTVELRFGDETGLAELVETLETLASPVTH